MNDLMKMRDLNLKKLMSQRDVNKELCTPQITLNIDYNRDIFLSEMSSLINKYESNHKNNNDCVVKIEFFDGLSYTWDGEKLILAGVKCK